MDQSNKPKEESAGTLFSDTQAKLEFVMGRMRLPEDQLSPDDWQAILLEVFKLVSPQLKYLSGFSELERFLNFSRRDYNWRETDFSIMDMPDDFSLKTRVIVLLDFFHQTEGKIEPGYGVRFITEKKLLLDKNGHFFVWEAKYERILETGQGFRSHRSGIREVAVVSKFSSLPDNKLVELFAYDQHAGRHILEKFQEFISETIRVSQERLEVWARKQEEMSGIWSRLDTPFR
jgi:hypothetical protein